VRFRNRPNRDFTIIRNSALKDPNLSLKAKGLLTLMLSYSDDWEYHLNHLVTLSTDGRDSLRSAVRELVKAGYVAREQQKDSSKRFGKAVYVVSDIPNLKKEEDDKKADVDGVRAVDGFSGDGISGDGFSGDGKPDTNKTNLKEDQKKEKQPPPPPQGGSVAQARRDSKVDALFRAYNENRGKLPAAVKLTETRRRALRRLLKELGDEALPYLVDATLCVAADSFWQEKGYGLENLLVRGRVVAKAEQYRQLHKAKQSPVDPDDQPEPYTGPDVGDVVRLPNGLVRAVQDVDHFGNWLIFDDHPAVRPHEVQVVDQQGVLQ